MEDMLINITSDPKLLVTTFGVGGTATISATCSFLSSILPDTLVKESKLLGVRVGAIRGIYNPFMKFVNKVAFNSGKAANDPKLQKKG